MEPSNPIQKFDGTEYWWLSNFAYSPIPYPNDRIANTVEAYFQATKTLDPLEQDKILAAPFPAQAKRLGRKVTLRDDWETIKLQVMLNALRWKFHPDVHPNLVKALLETGDRALIEGNQWGDKFWGQVAGEGLNWLGRLLMRVREELREK